MFGIGFSELLVIGVILIVAVGPKRMPGMLKAVVRAYHEFRRATRELRANTGIDELLHDDDLKSLRKPLHVPPPKKPAGSKRTLSAAEQEREPPSEDGEAIHAAKVAAMPREADDEKGEQIAAMQRVADDERGERSRAAKGVERRAHADGEE